LMGSIPYMSPEQMLGERVDYRSDLFLFGMLLYEMLTGAPPFEASQDDSTETLLERMQGRRYVPPGRRVPGVPYALRRLIRACLQPRPAKRIQSVAEIRRRLERHLGRATSVDCREAIAEYLVARKVVERTEAETAIRPLPGRTDLKLARRVRRLAAAATILVGMFAVGQAYKLGRGKVEPAVVAAPAQEVAGLSSRMLTVWRRGVSPELASTDPGLLVAASWGTAPANHGGLGRLQSAAPALEPARVRFAAYPWAEVRVGGAEGFLTPRAEALVLPPGAHEIVFSHPRFGEATYRLEFAEGEQRLIHHRYEKAGTP